MTSRPQRAKEIFVELVGTVPSTDWDRRLDEACVGDPELRNRVCALLRAHVEPGSFLEQPAVGNQSLTLDQPSVERPGTRIGPYRLLEQIGEGGMGVVYTAEQTEPVARRVALKIIKPGMDTQHVIARFEAERQALALMDHPNIAKVFDVGTTDSGRPYFVMELIHGIPVTQFCDQQHLTARERLELFIPICQAVQHAHQKGIIHRDIKPSNILIALYDGRPVPKVIDFGVAKAVSQKLTEKTMFTGLGQIVGTLEYMSPEQAQPNQLDIDTRSDVYSLGVVLYELLTGDTPFDKQRLRSSAWDEMLRIIREEEPPTPSTRLSSGDALPSVAANRNIEPGKLSAVVRGDLDWIVMQALEKDRNHRYATANDMAEDIGRYLCDEAVLAGPPTAAYRLRKFARRNKRGIFTAAAGVLVVLLAVAAIGGSAGYLIRDREVRLAETARMVEMTLDEATAFEQQGKWSAALGAAQRAQAVVDTQAGNDELRARVQQRIKDLTMVLRVEEIQLEASAVQDEHFDWGLGDRLYAQAFRDYGIDVEALTPEEVAQRMPDGAVRRALAAALDRWVPYRPLKDWKHFVAAARATDPDPWRDRVREAWINNDKKTAQELLLSVPRERLHTPQVLLMKHLLTHDEYRALLSDAQLRHPGDFWLNHNLAYALSIETDSGDAREALRFYQAALALRPESPGVLLNLANALRKLDRHDEAIAVLERAMRLKPRYVAAHNNLGNALGGIGDRAGAEEAYRTAIQIDPSYALAHSNLGGLLKTKGDLAGAEEALRTAIRIDPNYASAHYNLGSTLSAIGTLDEAEAELREAIRLNPRFTEAHCNLGALLAGKGDLAGAEKAHREAVRINTNHAQAINGLGGFLCDYRQDYDGAIAAFRRAIGLGLKDGRAQYNLGIALAKKGALDESIAAFRQAIALNPKDGSWHCWLGEVLRRTGQTKESMEALQTAITLDPNLAAAHDTLGQVLSDNGDLDGAIGQYQQAIRLEPNDYATHMNLCNALMHKQSWDAAIAAVREAIRCKPDLPQAHCNLGRALQKKGRLLDALEAFQRGHELGSKDPNWKYPSTQWIQECQELLKESEAKQGVTLPTAEPAPEPAAKVEETKESSKSTPAPEAANEEELPE